MVSAPFPKEWAKGILDVDTATPSTITSHAPGYIHRDRELIVGLQTDAPLKSTIHRPPFGMIAPDINTYRKLTGGELAPTLSFATRLDRLGVPMWIRYVLVPGWTDDEEAVEGLARFVAGLGTVDRVDVLPFHKLGAAKYDALGLPFLMRDTPVPAPGLTERVRARFRAHGLSAY